LRFTFDRDFDAVIAACAGPRREHVPLTWITPKMMWA
jgi:leucyl/phenylalanyl-tRNA---protein transferase